MLKSEYQFRGMHSHTRSNKEFVKLREQLTKHYRDYQIADKMGVPHSTFSKYKLGYFQPSSRELVALRMIVDNTYGSPVSMPSKKVSVNKPFTDTKLSRDEKHVVINIPTEFKGSVTINVK